MSIYIINLSHHHQYTHSTCKAVERAKMTRQPASKKNPRIRDEINKMCDAFAIVYLRFTFSLFFFPSIFVCYQFQLLLDNIHERAHNTSEAGRHICIVTVCSRKKGHRSFVIHYLTITCAAANNAKLKHIILKVQWDFFGIAGSLLFVFPLLFFFVAVAQQKQFVRSNKI